MLSRSRTTASSVHRIRDAVHVWNRRVSLERLFEKAAFQILKARVRAGKRRDFHGNHSVWLRKRWYVRASKKINPLSSRAFCSEKSILSRANSMHASLTLRREKRGRWWPGGSTSRGATETPLHQNVNAASKKTNDRTYKNRAREICVYTFEL